MMHFEGPQIWDQKKASLNSKIFLPWGDSSWKMVVWRASCPGSVSLRTRDLANLRSKPLGVDSQSILEFIDVASCTLYSCAFWLLALASLAFYQWLVRPTDLTIHCRSTSRTFQVCHCQGQGREPTSLENLKETDVENTDRMWWYDIMDVTVDKKFGSRYWHVLTGLSRIWMWIDHFVAASVDISALALHWKNSAGFRCRCWSNWAKDMQLELATVSSFLSGYVWKWCALRSNYCVILPVSSKD